jgi:energy-converting hydrogenase Eha subunit A
MGWKARDWTGCFVAALAAAVAGAVFGRMSGCFRIFENEEWLRWGAADFRKFPEWYFGLLSVVPLLVVCGILRHTLFRVLPAPRRQRMLVSSMLLAAALAVGFGAALILTMAGLGRTEPTYWSWWFQRAFRAPHYAGNDLIWSLIVTAFVQGGVLGGVAGLWFPASEQPAEGRLKSRRMRQATVGTLLVLFSVALTILIPYKKGEDRRSCMLNCRNFQQAMRSYSGVNGIGAGDAVPGFSVRTLVNQGFFSAIPACPGGGRYEVVEGRAPEVGELMIRCSCPEHVPTGVEHW